MISWQERMKKHKTTTTENGFTLIEAMVAIFILTVGLLSLGQLMLVSLDKSEFAKYDTKAVHLAQAKLEELRTLFGAQVANGGLPLSDLAAGSHGPETVVLRSKSGSLQGTISFQVSWQVVDLSSGRKTISVTVAPVNANQLRNDVLTLATNLTP